MTIPRWATWAICVALFSLSLWIFDDSAKHAPFWGDESANLRSARYFQLAFVDRDFASSEWADNWWVHNQPMLRSFITGYWLWRRGYDLDDMPRRYDFGMSYEENARKERVPSDQLLADGRRPMVVLAAAAIVALFLLGAQVRGLVAGVTAASLALGSPLLREHLVRVMLDAPLAVFMLLSLVLGVRAIRRSSRGPISPESAIIVGVALGLAVAAKLTGMLSVVGTGTWAAVDTTARIVRAQRRDAGHRTRWLRSIRPAWDRAAAWALVALVTFAVFVAADPHLWRGPLLHTQHLLNERLADERLRQREDPQRAVRDPLARVRLVVVNSLFAGTALGSLGVPVELILATVGLGALLLSTVKSFRPGAQPNGDGLVLATTLAYYLGTMATLYNLHDRYFVPTLLLAILLSGVGAELLVRRTLVAVQRGGMVAAER